MLMSPPFPTEAWPTENTMLPERTPWDEPVENLISPDLTAADPVSTVTAPLSPAEENAVLTVTSPPEVSSLPDPEVMETAPPLPKASPAPVTSPTEMNIDPALPA
jgi:hypothetical protein